MQTVYSITFAHHIQLEGYRHVLMYYRTSKICPAMCIHINITFHSQLPLLNMCYRTLLTTYIAQPYTGSLYLLLPLMTKLVSVYQTHLSSMEATYIFYTGPTCLCFNSTMSTYDYVYLIFEAMSSMTLLSQYSYIHFQFISILFISSNFNSNYF